MEENHRDLTQSFDSPDAQNYEIRIAMSSVEENIRKLYEASKMGCIQTLKTLIQEDLNLIQKVLISTSIIESPLHVSVSHSQLEFTHLLLDHKPELATEVDALQRTPLHLASANGDMEIVRALLEKNTSACLVHDQNGLIPLHYGVISGKIEIMKELINARPQSVLMKLNNGQTVLHLCVKSNHLEAMKLVAETFVNCDKDFLNTTDDTGSTVLDLSLMLRRIEMVGYLLSIPEVKTGSSTGNFFAASNIATKRSRKTIIKQTRNPKRKRRELPASPRPAEKTTGWWKVLRKNLKYKGDWVQEVQGTMMLVATVIATVTFQAAINPPGGVWQQDIQYNSSSIAWGYYSSSWHSYNDTIGKTFLAGTAIMASQQQEDYWIYLMTNTVSFMASVSVILLIISRFPLKNRVGSWVLALAMCAAVLFLALGYLLGVRMVSMYTFPEEVIIYLVYRFTMYVWLGLVGVVGLCYVIRFLVWLVKCLLHTFA